MAVVMAVSMGALMVVEKVAYSVGTRAASMGLQKAESLVVRMDDCMAALRATGMAALMAALMAEHEADLKVGLRDN